MAEPEALLDQREAGTAGGAACGDLVSDVAMSPADGGEQVSGADDAEFRSTSEHGSQHFEPSADSVVMQIDASETLPTPPSSLSGSSGDGQDLTQDIRAAVQRSVVMFTGGEGPPIPSGMWPVASEPTVAVPS